MRRRHASAFSAPKARAVKTFERGAEDVFARRDDGHTPDGRRRPHLQRRPAPRLPRAGFRSGRLLGLGPASSSASSCGEPSFDASSITSSMAVLALPWQLLVVVLPSSIAVRGAALLLLLLVHGLVLGGGFFIPRITHGGIIDLLVVGLARAARGDHGRRVGNEAPLCKFGTGGGRWVAGSPTAPRANEEPCGLRAASKFALDLLVSSQDAS